MICVQFVKKLFFKRSCFERARATLLQLYASSVLQSNGNNDNQCLPTAPQANRVSTRIHGNPLLSTGFAVGFDSVGEFLQKIS